MLKDIVIKYANEIDDLVRVVRRRISDRSEELSQNEIREIAEDAFFTSTYSFYIKVGEMGSVINSVCARCLSRYGVLKDILEDPEIDEIMVNGPHMIFVESGGEIEEYDNAFTTHEELEDMIRMFASDVHREINEANPIVDARLDNGYRVNGVLSNVALNGPILTIRKFTEEMLTLDDLVESGSMTRECCDLLIKLVRSGYNIFISGGTSSGKTTFLNALTSAIDTRERAIIIEDSAELKIAHLPNRVHMECRNANSIGKGEVTMDKLIKTSLRMRPDRIIVGEVRGREVIDMIQAMSTGHDGSMSTGHGNSIKGMLSRLETMYLMDSQIPIYSVRSQIANAIDIFVHLRRGSDGKRGVVEVAEITGYNNEKYGINYLFATDKNGKLVSTGSVLMNTEKLRRHGYADRI